MAMAIFMRLNIFITKIALGGKCFVVIKSAAIKSIYVNFHF